MELISSSSNSEQGIDEFTLNIAALYQDKAGLMKFWSRWESFCDANGDDKRIFERSENTITYQSENLIPTKLDSRPTVLLVFGNPASHSVVNRMCFAFEKDLKEHRIWRLLRKTGWLTFFSDEPESTGTWQDRNIQRKKEFFDLEYESPFRLGITVALSLPSPASDKNWGGVAGVKKLFGTDTFSKIEEFEKKRLRKLRNTLLTNSNPSCVIAFQKDAYELLRSDDSPKYSLKQAREPGLFGHVSNGLDAVPLVGLPPTRYALAEYYGDLLTGIKGKILSGSNNTV